MPRRTYYRQGTPNWVELQTPDQEAAKSFYGPLFSWEFDEFDDRPTARGPVYGGSPFTGFVVGEDMIGGIIPPQREGAEHRWIVYFAVADVAEAVERAKALDGTIVHGPIDTPVGPLAALRDPQGGAFSVWSFNGPTT
jgi:predicted enzyme related to lactoylglutathione lyase